MAATNYSDYVSSRNFIPESFCSIFNINGSHMCSWMLTDRKWAHNKITKVSTLQVPIKRTEKGKNSQQALVKVKMSLSEKIEKIFIISSEIPAMKTTDYKKTNNKTRANFLLHRTFCWSLTPNTGQAWSYFSVVHQYI